MTKKVGFKVFNTIYKGFCHPTLKLKYEFCIEIGLVSCKSSMLKISTLKP